MIVTKINTGKASAAAALAAYAQHVADPSGGQRRHRPERKVGIGHGHARRLGSTQAQGHALSYAWTQTAGPAVTLSSTHGAEADVHGAEHAGDASRSR